MSTIFVTGGAGYIGSHTCVELLQAGHEVIVFDNFCNSHPEALRRVESITGRQLTVVRGDIRDQAAMEAALREHACHAVIHFAGLKAVGESTQQPVAYYDNNFVGTVRLLQAMSATGVKTLVFSSSATVYGEPQALPLTETHPLSATNPYGRSKLMIEDMLRDVYRTQFGWWEDLNPTSLHPAHPVDVARELRAAITDPQAVIDRARALMEAGDLQLGLHVIDLLALGTPDDPSVAEAMRLKAEMCRLSAQANPSYVTQSLYLNGADELELAVTAATEVEG